MPNETSSVVGRIFSEQEYFWIKRQALFSCVSHLL
jgi:hypothetical protein